MPFFSYIRWKKQGVIIRMWHVCHSKTKNAFLQICCFVGGNSFVMSKQELKLCFPHTTTRNQTGMLEVWKILHTVSPCDISLETIWKATQKLYFKRRQWYCLRKVNAENKDWLVLSKIVSMPLVKNIWRISSIPDHIQSHTLFTTGEIIYPLSAHKGLSWFCQFFSYSRKFRHST